MPVTSQTLLSRTNKSPRTRPVIDVARGEDAVHGRRGREAIMRLQDDVASIEFQLSLEDLGRGCVPDGQEEALHLEVGRLARLCIPDTDALDLGFAEDVDDFGIPDDPDVR